MTIFNQSECIISTQQDLKFVCDWVVVVVKWSTCSPSAPMIRVHILLKSTVFNLLNCLKRTKINKKAGDDTFLNILCL